MFDTVINGQPRKGIAEAGRTGWVSMLDRTNGKPLVGIEKHPVPQEPLQKTAKTQPFPIGDNTVPTCAATTARLMRSPAASSRRLASPVIVQPGGQGGQNWSPMPYSPDTGFFYVPGNHPDEHLRAHQRHVEEWAALCRWYQAAPIGSQFGGTFTAIDNHTNKIAWQQQMPHRMGGGGGSTATAGGLLLRGEPDGNFVILRRKTATSFGRSRPASARMHRPLCMR